MFGIESLEFIGFVRQLGIAVSGAASLWALVFILKARSTKSNVSRVIFHWVAHRLTYLIYGGAAVAMAGWITLRIYATPSAHAHEGVSLAATLPEILSALALTTPVFVFWLAAVLLSIVLQFGSQRIFHDLAPFLFGLHFLIATFLISSAPAWTGEFSNEKVFFILHNFHSILTLGTVLILDYLFLSIKSSVILQRHVFPLFPWISKVIWIGLGLDFLSVAFIFPEAVSLDARFFFAQTIVGVLIINGVILAGPLTRKILDTLKHGIESMQKRWRMVADVSGTISITSWSAITFVDFFHSLEFSYGELMGIYGSMLIVLFVLHLIWERWDREEPDISNA